MVQEAIQFPYQNIFKENYMNWYLITINDTPEYLSGKSIFNILNILVKVENIEFTILDYIHGSGKNGLIYSLQEDRYQVYEIENLLKIVCNIVQLDWGDFFLFKKYPNNWDNAEGEDYPYVIAQTDLTFRAVDNQYFYIYTQNKKIVDIVKSIYLIESIKFDLLKNLDFPE